ncbi:MAG: hypothetical protein ACREXR_14560, partial [Gammaproteobacteria bacterium]
MTYEEQQQLLADYNARVAASKSDYERRRGLAAERFAGTNTPTSGAKPPLFFGKSRAEIEAALKKLHPNDPARVQRRLNNLVRAHQAYTQDRFRLVNATNAYQQQLKEQEAANYGVTQDVQSMDPRLRSIDASAFGITPEGQFQDASGDPEHRFDAGYLKDFGRSTLGYKPGGDIAGTLK